MAIEKMNNLLAKLVRESGLMDITSSRLRRQYPASDWIFTGDHCLHQETLFLHFAEKVESRMWWVKVETDFAGELAMSWNMEGISDLV